MITDLVKKELKEYSEKFGIPEVVNDYGETRCTNPNSIVFDNGWVASIVDTPEDTEAYSVAACDYNGYFDWNILNNYGTVDGRFHCDTIDEVIASCEIIRRLPKGSDE